MAFSVNRVIFRSIATALLSVGELMWHNTEYMTTNNLSPGHHTIVSIVDPVTNTPTRFGVRPACVYEPRPVKVKTFRYMKYRYLVRICLGLQS